jgi:DNA-binding transcriptional LysR family regulator
MDRLTSLTAFVRVADSGGFSAAAKRLNMSVQMVSNHVKALEDRLGARLLNRTTRKVGLTDTGKAYYDRCTQILSEIEEADRIAGALDNTPRGTLRLFTGSHIVRVIAPVVAEFLARHPAVSIDLTVGERMIDIVEESFDLAIRMTPPPDSSLIVRNLTTWRHVLCCAPDYFAGDAAPRRPADLAGHNCLRYAFYPFGDEWRFTGPGGKPAAARVSGNLVSNSGEVLRQVTLHGQGVFLAPSFVVADDLAAGRLVRILEDYRPLEFTINAVYPHRHHVSSKVRTFLDMATARFAEHRNWLDPTDVR